MADLTKKRRKELEELESEDTKYCTICKKIRPLFEFTVHPEGRKFANTYCIECERKRSREKTLRKYDITLKEYDKLLEKQDGKCKICKTKIPGGSGRFHIDHDHKINGRKGIRGLLCNNCNLGLGYFRDNPETLITAAQYLMENKHD